MTRSQIDDLLRFLPLFGTAGPDTVVETDENSTYPSYTDDVEEFFRLAGLVCSRSYDPQIDGAKVHDDQAIEAATLDGIERMLAFCVRGERFSDGHWGGMIREGRIGAILRRLSELRDTVN